MTFHRDAWYMAAWPEDVGRMPCPRTILGEPVVLYRLEDDTPVALADRCPHRFAPLSRGRLIGDAIECGYHGLRFDGGGRCALNPHGSRTGANLSVRAYPLAELHGIVWIWMGDPERARPDGIPDLAFMAPAPGRRTVHHYLRGAYPYELLIDNLLDLSHTDYLHGGSLSSGTAEYTELVAEEHGDDVVVERTQMRAPAPPRYEHVGDIVDITYRMRWHPSQVVAFQRFITPTGRPRTDGVETRFCHMATPETATTTHYFHAVTRHDHLDNPEVDRRQSELHQAIFGKEDGGMLEAVFQSMGGPDLLDLRPVILPVDAGAMRVRAVMQRLLAVH